VGEPRTASCFIADAPLLLCGEVVVGEGAAHEAVGEWPGFGVLVSVIGGLVAKVVPAGARPPGLGVAGRAVHGQEPGGQGPGGGGVQQGGGVAGAEPGRLVARLGGLGVVAADAYGDDLYAGLVGVEVAQCLGGDLADGVEAVRRQQRRAPMGFRPVTWWLLASTTRCTRWRRAASST
jgi:hypothetical protein